jgi:hypothetical protein
MGERRHSSYSLLTSELGGVSGQLHTPATLYPREITPGTRCVGDWVGHRAGLDKGSREKMLCLYRGPNPGRQVCSHTLY